MYRNKWLRRFSEYQWDLLNQMMKTSDQSALIQSLENLVIADVDEKFGLDMRDLKEDVAKLIREIKKMDEQEVLELFYYLPVDPFCGASLSSYNDWVTDDEGEIIGVNLHTKQ